MDYKMEELEIKEELMIYIANHLPFIVKGSFLTRQYHKDPLARLKSGGDIDLIYTGSVCTIPKPDTYDYDTYHTYIREVEKLLKPELIDILYKLEEIMTRKLELTERPEFILDLETLGYDRLFKDSVEVYFSLVNYAADGDFVTVGFGTGIGKYDVEIDIAIDMPVHFQPETILYRTLAGKEVMLKNTTPLIYQTAWKIHQIIVRPRMKDLDDVIRFLPHIDFEDRHIFELFFDEIISECELTNDKIYKTLIDTLKKLFTKEEAMQIFQIGTIVDNWGRVPYYSDLYGGIPCQIGVMVNLVPEYHAEELEQEVCSCFLKALHSRIDCDEAVKYIEKRCHLNVYPVEYHHEQ